MTEFVSFTMAFYGGYKTSYAVWNLKEGDYIVIMIADELLQRKKSSRRVQIPFP